MIIPFFFSLAVPVRGPVRSGGDAEPERDEPIPQPVARLLLLRTRPPKLGAQDVAGAARERGGRAESASRSRQGQLPGPARPLLRRGGGRGGQDRHVPEGLYLLKKQAVGIIAVQFLLFHSKCR